MVTGFETADTRADHPTTLYDRIRGAVRASPKRAPYIEIGIGFLAAVVAVAIRLSLPLHSQQLPILAVVVALAIVTPYVGARAGLTCAVTGAIASWLWVFDRAWIPLIGFGVISTVIICTSHLYRTSERLHYERELRELETQAQNARIFAGEMSHRLKNALAIVQSIAFQTMDPGAPGAIAFAKRLKALADANDLLSEHVSKPVADVADVIEAAIHPFRDGEGRFRIESPQQAIPAQQVISLALALHELCTNAVKYGSLSQPQGRVAINVEDRPDHLALVWKETGGPLVRAPERTGFGTRLLQRSGMGAELDYAPDGLRCVLAIRKD